MRRIAALALPVLLAAASAQVIPTAPTANEALARARVEADQAARRLAALEDQAAKAGDEASRLRAQQAAASAAIEEAEARISRSEAGLRLANAQMALAERDLAAKRAPLAALLAGLVTMGRQPPILTLADRGSVEEMVRVKALLDATMPVIERRSAALRSELARRRDLADAARGASTELAEDRKKLEERRVRFAGLETKASDRAAKLSGEAFGAGDRVLASTEALSLAGTEAAERQAARAAASRIRQQDFAPARPFRGDSALPHQDFAYSLPVSAPLDEGLGSVNRAGIASRGLRFGTGRGMAVIAPADGHILFAAPYREQDGVVIIDHGNGWTSVLLGVASEKPKGMKVRRGELLGRSLGPLSVELRRNGVPVSPALIAASSVPLSNGSDSR